MAKTQSRANVGKLLFVDTNILLDFYRTRNETGLALLEKLESLSSNLIMTYQVEMEFKKNRQKAILESFTSLKSVSSITIPGLFSHSPTARALKRILDSERSKVAMLKKRLKGVLNNPTTHDPVYKSVQRMFRKEDDLNLTRENPQRFKIRRLAWKRFILGYPPRKREDTSTGDAINWEWIVQCATQHRADIIIVSRDADYGVFDGDESFINDWLQQEFRARVKTKRKLRLCTQLTQAFKEFHVEVTKEETQEETLLSPTESSGNFALETVVNQMDATKALWGAWEKFIKLNNVKESTDPTPGALPPKPQTG